MMEIEQGMDIRIHDKHDIAAATAVATVWSTERLEFLAVD
jgi:hypothetical protein